MQFICIIKRSYLVREEYWYKELFYINTLVMVLIDS